MRRLAAVLLATIVSGCATSATSPSVPAASPASSSAVASSTSTVSPSHAPALGWTQIATVDAPDPAGDFRRIAGFAGGYVALVQSPAAAVFSPDGVTWTSVDLAVPDGHALRAAVVGSDGQHLVIGGSYTPCTRKAFEANPYTRCRPRPATWMSTDGRTWTASDPYAGPNGDPLRSGSAFEAVWRIPTGGWDAAQMFDKSDESDDFPSGGPAIWHSDDGLAWVQLTSAPGDDPPCRALAITDRMHAAADATGRRLVSASDSLSDCTSPVWTSADGTEYTNLDTFPHSGTNLYYTIVLAAEDGIPWRVFGGDETKGGQVWTSVDLATWSVIPLGSGEAIDAVPLAGIRANGRDIVVGRAGSAGATWIGTDGTTWQSVDASGTRIEALADGPAGTLGLIGTWDDNGGEVTGFEVYRLDQDR